MTYRLFSSAAWFRAVTSCVLPRLGVFADFVVRVVADRCDSRESCARTHNLVVSVSALLEEPLHIAGRFAEVLQRLPARVASDALMNLNNIRGVIV